MPPPSTTTPLELVCDALACAVAAYAYPSDLEQRMLAVQTCARLKLDYIELLAAGLGPTTATPDEARWAVVVALALQVDKLRAAGATPRPGVLVSGRPCDALGREPEYEQGESWDA